MPPLGNLGTLRSSQQQPVHAPLSRAWHVNLQHGGGETITAHECRPKCGVLSFYNHPAPDDRVLVRAFGPREWCEVELIDTPFATAVHLPPHERLRDDART